MGRWLADGNIEFLGRVDNQVKLHGFRIELAEIEATLTRHPCVVEAVVAVRQGSGGGKYLAAYLVTRPDRRVSDRELADFCGRQLPSYMVPTRFVRLSRLPLNVNGKIDRAALPASQIDSVGESHRCCPPQTATERRLAQLWAEVLDLEPIGRNADFIQLGGDSLQAVELLVRIEQSFGVELELASILGSEPRLMQLARRIDEGCSANYAPPRDSWELRLSQIWERHLDVRPLSIDVGFFDLGGDMALALRLMAEVSQHFGRNLAAEVLVARPTIEQLAELLRGKPLLRPRSSLIVLQASGQHPPLICLPGIFGTTWEFRRLAQCLGADFPVYALPPVGVDGVASPLRHDRRDGAAQC